MSVDYLWGMIVITYSLTPLAGEMCLLLIFKIYLDEVVTVSTQPLHISYQDALNHTETMLAAQGNVHRSYRTNVSTFSLISPYTL